ncbi:MAG: NAD(P)H-binding protein [Rikenellaceae bacterium]
MKKKFLLIGDVLHADYNLVNPLMKEYQLRIFLNKPVSANLYSDENVEYIYGSLNRYEDVLYAVEGCDTVIISNITPLGSAPIPGLENIRRAISQSGVRRVIYSDSQGSKSGGATFSVEDCASFNHWG